MTKGSKMSCHTWIDDTDGQELGTSWVDDRRQRHESHDGPGLEGGFVGRGWGMCLMAARKPRIECGAQATGDEVLVV